MCIYKCVHLCTCNINSRCKHAPPAAAQQQQQPAPKQEQVENYLCLCSMLSYYVCFIYTYMRVCTYNSSTTAAAAGCAQTGAGWNLSVCEWFCGVFYRFIRVYVSVFACMHVKLATSQQQQHSPPKQEQVRICMYSYMHVCIYEYIRWNLYLLETCWSL